MAETLLLSPGPEEAGMRIDAYLGAAAPGLTRSAAQRLLANGAVTIGGKALKKNYKVAASDEIVILLPDVKQIDLTPENLPLDIVYEDDSIIVINKTRGMVVHPAAGNWNGTLVHALMYHCGDRLSGINGELRPGIVHRIDKDTSGLLVVAKNDAAHQHLSAQIQRHDVKREYEAIVIGTFREAEGTISLPIARHPTDRKRMAVCAGGREAVTHYQTIASYSGYSHMGFRLETGRTHQIRVHMAAAGHPIIGDPVYGMPKDRFSTLNGQCLHAAHLTLVHPETGETMRFDAPLPEYFLNVLEKIRKMT